MLKYDTLISHWRNLRSQIDHCRHLRLANEIKNLPFRLRDAVVDNDHFTGWSLAKAASLSARIGISSLWMSDVQARTPCLVLPQVSSEMPETP